MFFAFFNDTMFSQTGTPTIFSWNVNVGCQEYPKPRGESENPNLFLEDITPGACIKVCEYTSVTYSLNGGLNSASNVQWTVVGGSISPSTTINTATSSSTLVSWGAPGLASITFTFNSSSGGTISKTVCIEIIRKPTANFTAFPMETDVRRPIIYACVGQEIILNNISTTNGGTAIVNNYWDFGDRTYSSAINPTHIYNEEGSYDMTLTVTNSCGCSTTKTRKVIIKNTANFQISCPSVVCEGQTSTYNLPFDELQVCQDYNFTCTGGTIYNPNNGTVTVTWDQVDASGFGLLTFDPAGCDLECLSPTTIRIPVIQSTGTIVGNTTMCIGEQERFKLPQWPTTDFHWTIQGNVNNSLGLITNTDQRNEIIFTPSHAGTITILCTYQNTLLHCGGVASITIHVNKKETITGQTSLCINSTGNYHTQTNDAVDWTLKRNNAVVNIATHTVNYSYNFTIAGNYTLTVSGDDVCEFQTISITVNAIPTALILTNINQPNGLPEAMPLKRYCPLTPYTFSINSPNPIMDYEWSIAGGTYTGSNLENEFTVLLDQTGPYEIKVRQKIKNQATCVSPWLIITPIIFQIPATISNSPSDINTSLTACTNASKTYYVVNNITSTTATSPYTTGDSYSWSISPSNLGTITSGQDTRTATVLWNNVATPTQAILRVTISKCTRTTTFEIPVTILPMPDLTLTSPNVCSGTNAQLTLNSVNGVPLPVGTVIQWEYGNGDSYGQVLTTSATTVNHSYQYFTSTAVNQTNFHIQATIQLPVNGDNCTGNIIKNSDIVIAPGPGAEASTTGGNTFCLGNPITAVMHASTTTGATFQWYKAPHILLTGQTTNTLTITNALGAGSYFLRTTLNGCTSQSRNNQIFVVPCSPPLECYVNGNPTVSIAQISCSPTPVCEDCGQLNLLATTSDVPVDAIWNIFGPDPNTIGQDLQGVTLYDYNMAITTAGYYHIIYKPLFTCTTPTGATATAAVPAEMDITVPYIAKFSNNIFCANGGGYTITLTDNSNFIDAVTNRHFYYDWSTSPTGPWTAINTTSTPVVSFTPATFGTYYFRLRIDGTLNGTLMQACRKTNDPLNLDADQMPPIRVQQNFCYNSAFKFDFETPDLTDTAYLWSFDTLSTSGLPIATSGAYPTFRVFDPSPNGASRTVRVTVQITNRYGCIRTITQDIPIPARCFFGDITTNSIAICTGGSMVLNYTQNATQPDTCTPAKYIWMDGNTVLGNTTTSSFTITTVTGSNHFYWVKLNSSLTASQSCNYSVPSRIVPSLLPNPTASLIAPGIICQSNGASTANVITNATHIQWFVDGVLQANTTSVLSLSTFSLGNHTLTVIVDNGPGTCSKTVTQNFSIRTTPGNPTASYRIEDCASYKISLIASPPAGGTGTLVWSSGTTGNPTTVYSGGPYMVTYNDGSGCNTYAQVDVPYSVDKYLWIFPTGCYTQCSNNLGTIIGPQAYIPEWAWLYNNDNMLSGSGYPLPYAPVRSGSYNLDLTSACHQTSGTMNLSIAECDKCEIGKISVKEIKCNNDALNAYNVILSIDNAGGILNTTVSVPNNEVVISPAAFSMSSGSNLYSFTVIPINGFTGGTVTIVFTGINDHGALCTYSIDIDFPECKDKKMANKFPPSPNGDVPMRREGVRLNSLQLYPNPAQNTVNIIFDVESNNSEILIYDLTGKVLGNYPAIGKNGTQTIDVTAFAKGIYIVVLKEDGISVMQKKLIIN